VIGLLLAALLSAGAPAPAAPDPAEVTTAARKEARATPPRDADDAAMLRELELLEKLELLDHLELFY
jgi:hypothetical protein